MDGTCVEFAVNESNQSSFSIDTFNGNQFYRLELFYY